MRGNQPVGDQKPRESHEITSRKGVAIFLGSRGTREYGGAHFVGRRKSFGLVEIFLRKGI